ncbi:MAG: disulfide bond formation protein B [Magnetovibrio sp.]|nr:disulfide bond formation protein B [Magnetovibrio sp.]
MNEARLYPKLLAGVGAGALIMAYIAQFGFGLEPCVLCLYQRIPYALVAILGFIAMKRPQNLNDILVASAVVFAASTALAAYHFGVEQHWWVSATGCTGDVSKTFTTQDLLQSMQRKQPKACDAVDWTLFGLSMAGWNVLFSIFCVHAIIIARMRLRED